MVGGGVDPIVVAVGVVAVGGSRRGEFGDPHRALVRDARAPGPGGRWWWWVLLVPSDHRGGVAWCHRRW
jgi:hypothetical protein